MKKFKIIVILLIVIIAISCSKDDDPVTVTQTPISASNLAISSISPTSGLKNTTVTLRGVDFSSNILSNTVTLNGKLCTVNSASTTVLSITIPRGAGSGDINVTVAGVTVQSPNFKYLITPSVVSTFAGSIEGFANGTGTAAQFRFPTGIAVDGLGSMYVADYENHKIRKISPTGVVSTFAGSIQGFADGISTVARFNSPYGVAIDPIGNLYVADSENHKIRKISPTGVVSTFAGSTQGFLNGSALAAQFNNPTDVAVDALGNVYVADSNNHKIRKITQGGFVDTLAGSLISGFADGVGINAQFNSPNGVTVDSRGNVYVADSENHKIRKISPTGVVTTFAGSSNGFANGSGTAAEFSYPIGVKINAEDDVYVADHENHKIRKISPTGVVTTLAGSTQGFADGAATIAQFDFPIGVALDALGDIYIVDLENHKIRKVTQD